jgi:hypothetical protein
LKPADEGLTAQAALSRLLESKRVQRQKLAALPFAEKFRLVAEMREMTLAIKRAKPADEGERS